MNVNRALYWLLNAARRLLDAGRAFPAKLTAAIDHMMMEMCP